MAVGHRAWQQAPSRGACNQCDVDGWTTSRKRIYIIAELFVDFNHMVDGVYIDFDNLCNVPFTRVPDDAREAEPV